MDGLCVIGPLPLTGGEGDINRSSDSNKWEV